MYSTQSTGAVNELQWWTRQLQISDFTRGVQSHLPSRPILDSPNACNQASARIVCTPLHGPVQFAILRLLENAASPWGNRHPHVTRVPRAKPTHYPTRHLDRFSRVCMGPKCYAVQCIVSGEENPQNCPFPLGFRHPAGGGPSHGHRQHAKEIGKDRACGSGDILADKQSDKQTDRQTCSSQYFATARAGEVSNTILHQPITSITTIICTTLWPLMTSVLCMNTGTRTRICIRYVILYWTRVGRCLTAPSTQFRSYHTFKVELYYKH